MNALLETFKKLGPVRLAALGGVAAALIGLFVFMSGQMSATEMAVLYGDLEATDSSQIVTKLEAMGVPYELQGDGSQILVPRDQAPRLRMSMAEEGLPTGGSIGYEIFDRGDGLGTTNFVQQVNHLRALEGELARTIRSIGQVKSARVHLVMPERELFSRERRNPSASIILTLDRGASLDQGQVVAIQHLVAAAVPGLRPSAISIVDNWGTLLARGGDGEGAEGSGTSADAMRAAFEKKMTAAIEELLQRSLGFGKIRAQVTADMDFDRITTNSEVFDPEGQVVRSTQTVEENADSTEGSEEDAVSVGENLPDADANTPGTAVTSATRSGRNEETVNYEISKKVETHVREAGVVRRLSIAILVDGNYQANEDGTATYVPRSAEELANIEKLVRSASGFDAERGDTVEVVNMQFAPEDVAAAENPDLIMGFERSEIMRMAQMGLFAILTLAALLFVVRPMLNRILDVAKGGAAGQAALTDQTGQLAALPGPDGQLALPAGTAGALSPVEQMIDLEQVEGRVKASSLKKINELVDKHPEEAVNIMRNWMHQEA